MAHHDRLGALDTPFVGLDDLIGMKRKAGRPIDVADIVELERIRRDREQDSGRDR